MFATTILGWTITTLWAIVILIFWIAIAFWPARVAGRKGHSFFGYFIFSLFFFPLAILMAYLSSDRSKHHHPTEPADEE